MATLDKYLSGDRCIHLYRDPMQFCADCLRAALAQRDERIAALESELLKYRVQEACEQARVDAERTIRGFDASMKGEG